jgi:hypothetical protein
VATGIGATLVVAVPAHAATASPNGSITCSLVAEGVKTDSIYAQVDCSAPVDEIVIDVWGEDASGDTTWSNIKTCTASALCSGVWKGSSLDVTQWACGSTSFFGSIKGTCEQVFTVGGAH